LFKGVELSFFFCFSFRHFLVRLSASRAFCCSSARFASTWRRASFSASSATFLAFSTVRA
jgi:hypothetical protein